MQILRNFEIKKCELNKYKAAVEEIEENVICYSSDSSSSCSILLKDNRSMIIDILSSKSLISVIKDKGKNFVSQN